ncbi:winged helix-turn-helix domain-containing protein [Myxococcus sp. RHST-1-4]|nr:winged helix-turn-helix domain-containing protein [Myxococcus sp. RHSTA-1-4]
MARDTDLGSRWWLVSLSRRTAQQLEERRRHEAGGSSRGLKARPRTGRPSKLRSEEWQQVARLVRAGARTSGFPTERWTLTRVAHLIHRTFGVRYHPNYLAERLHRLGLSPQQPRTRAKELLPQEGGPSSHRRMGRPQPAP